MVKRMHILLVICGFFLLDLQCSRGQTWMPRLQPDCTAYDFTSCSVAPNIDDNGHYLYDKYWRNCTTAYTCQLVTPGASAFCSSTIVNYMAHIENGNVQKHDDYARCHYTRFTDLLSFMNCRDRHSWTCDDCLLAYKHWVCAMAFKKCDPNPLATPIPGFYLYGSDLHPTLPVSHFITKTCRGVCFDVFRKCPHDVRFKCPWKDSREYTEYPNCNLAGNFNATNG